MVGSRPVHADLLFPQVEVEVPKEKIIERIIEVPVERVIEKVVEVHSILRVKLSVVCRRAASPHNTVRVRKKQQQRILLSVVTSLLPNLGVLNTKSEFAVVFQRSFFHTVLHP